MRKQIITKYDVDEAGFYELYFNILATKIKISPRGMELLILWCSKPMTFVLDKRSERAEGSNKNLLAKELNISVNQISNLIRPLLIDGIVIINEEEELVFNNNITILRKTIKENIENEDFNFNYILNFNIKKKNYK